jgi:hypothetical protein
MKNLLEIVKSMANNPIHQYVVPGLTSELVGGEGHGMVRLFTTDRNSREWITPHSHRFDFSCLVLNGIVDNIIFKPSEHGDSYAIGFMRRSSTTHGEYDITRTGVPEVYEEFQNRYQSGDTYSMKADEIHSIRFSRGASVLFFEGPEVTDRSVFLEPFSNGKAVETFETKPWMFSKVASEHM